jgi:hypothetical protein
MMCLYVKFVTLRHNGGVIAGLDPAIHERVQRRQS